MAELATLARPYAQAIFTLGKETNSLDAWSDSLAFVDAVSTDDQFKSIANAPDIKISDVEKLFVSIIQDKVSKEVVNFVRLLVANGRLTVLSEVVSQFEKLKSDDDGLVEAKIDSAFELNADQIQTIVDGLSKKLNKKIDPAVNVDASLIGGIKIQVGDKVWDASVRGRLQEMTVALTN
jgi:F-type H+-transporting ATPase subunit delta